MNENDEDLIDILASMVDQDQDRQVEAWLELLKRKGVYPYEWMDSFDKFNHDKLPSKVSYISY